MSARALADLEDVHAFLQSDVPELKVAVAHGQMPAGELEDIMNAFYDGQLRRAALDHHRRDPASTCRRPTR